MIWTYLTSFEIQTTFILNDINLFLKSDQSSSRFSSLHFLNLIACYLNLFNLSFKHIYFYLNIINFRLIFDQATFKFWMICFSDLTALFLSFDRFVDYAYVITYLNAIVIIVNIFILSSNLDILVSNYKYLISN